jgi:hypothetical protein
VKGFNLDVIAHARIGLLGAPIDLTVSPGKDLGQARAAWMKGLARHGFLAQHATDPNQPATVSARVPCTKPKLLLSGLTPGASVSFRRGDRSCVYHGDVPVVGVGRRQRPLAA